MKVGELIQYLQPFDPEMKVLMTRSDSGLEDVVVCYEGKRPAKSPSGLQQ
jgi:hypothetical protein